MRQGTNRITEKMSKGKKSIGYLFARVLVALLLIPSLALFSYSLSLPFRNSEISSSYSSGPDPIIVTAVAICLLGGASYLLTLLYRWVHRLEQTLAPAEYRGSFSKWFKPSEGTVGVSFLLGFVFGLLSGISSFLALVFITISCCSFAVLFDVAAQRRMISKEARRLRREKIRKQKAEVAAKSQEGLQTHTGSENIETGPDDPEGINRQRENELSVRHGGFSKVITTCRKNKALATVIVMIGLLAVGSLAWLLRPEEKIAKKPVSYWINQLEDLDWETRSNAAEKIENSTADLSRYEGRLRKLAEEGNFDAGRLIAVGLGDGSYYLDHWEPSLKAIGYRGSSDEILIAVAKCDSWAGLTILETAKRELQLVEIELKERDADGTHSGDDFDFLKDRKAGLRRIISEVEASHDEPQKQ